MCRTSLPSLGIEFRTVVVVFGPIKRQIRVQWMEKMVIINGFPFLQFLKGHIPDSNGVRGDCWDCWPLSMLINLINYVHANPAAQWFRNYICPASFHPHFVGPFCCPPYFPQTFHDYIFAVRARASIKTINYEVGQRTTDIQMGFRLAYSLWSHTAGAAAKNTTTVPNGLLSFYVE